jgi:hypothetical protein
MPNHTAIDPYHYSFTLNITKWVSGTTRHTWNAPDYKLRHMGNCVTDRSSLCF